MKLVFLLALLQVIAWVFSSALDMHRTAAAFFLVSVAGCVAFALRLSIVFKR